MPRILQNIALYPRYTPRLTKIWESSISFEELRNYLIGDRFGVVHYLKKTISLCESIFFTSGDNLRIQGQWALENGMGGRLDLSDILLAQIEHHRTEIFYKLDPVRYGNAFLKRLPGCVRKTIAWRATPLLR